MDNARYWHFLTQLAGRLSTPNGIKLLVSLGIVASAYVFATMVWQVVPVNNNRGTVELKVSSSSSSSQSNVVSVDRLTALNLFGRYTDKPVVKVAPKPEAVAPKTRLNLTLTGVVADTTDETSKDSVAIIEHKNDQDTYAIGDKIDGTQASISQIFADRVILQVGSRFETLMLDGIEYSTDVPVFEPVTEVASPGPSIPDTEAADGARQILDKSEDYELSETLRSHREQLFDDPNKLLDVIRIQPYRVEGELKGYRLSPGKEAQLFEQVGLKANDLAVSINGYDLTDMQQALLVMKELRSMTDATITVLRDDVPVDIILAL